MEIQYEDLEINIDRVLLNSYTIKFEFSSYDSDQIGPIAHGEVTQEQFEAVKQTGHNDLAYGQALTQALFGPHELALLFSRARASMQSRRKSLRIHLFIDSRLPELHRLHWEKMVDPDKPNSRLLEDQNIVFSRYLERSDMREAPVRSWTKPRALVVISSPKNISEYHTPNGRNLAPLDVASELDLVKKNLGNIEIDGLVSDGKATLTELDKHLQKGIDILYLICHGALIKGKPVIWLEDNRGKVDCVDGNELANLIRTQLQTPRLVVLASCQSAVGSSEDEGALLSLGPLLSAAGVPAVIAMQDNIAQATSTAFMSTFFHELFQNNNGYIDQAMAVARRTVSRLLDWWVPVLFMRLKSGRIGYMPGFASNTQNDIWDSVISSISNGECTPILGPDLYQCLLGSHREIARQWAAKYHYPLEPQSREELPQVAQYLYVKRSRSNLIHELEEHLRETITKLYGDIPAIKKMLERRNKPTINNLIKSVGVELQKSRKCNVYDVLAELKLPIYFTTNYGCLLEESITANQRTPKSEFSKWNVDIKFKSDKEFRPNVECPIVYHLYGSFDEPNSLVLTEEDYFDFLISWGKHKASVPDYLQRVLADSDLLFLGFHFDDWDLRVLFRILQSQGGSKRRKQHKHVAIQVDPEE
ncbi:MAG: CHAT domain-containing protein [Methylobacter sp.]